MQNKPPYRIPLMEEIRAIEPNGFRAISTFAGCGGSSLGYRMAGFRIALASEFIPAAGDTYEANKHPDTILDRRDVRELTAGSILTQLGMNVGDLDLLDGSPPCSSFSMAGKRAALWGAEKKYSDTTQRTDDLFGEYLRLVDGLRPKVAVAENVPGLTIGVARGFYNEIMRGFEDLGYVADAAILQAEWLGVPQARHRLFFVAVREDLAKAGLKPVFPEPLGHYYSIADACPWILSGAFGSSTNSSHIRDGRRPTAGPEDPAPTLVIGGIVDTIPIERVERIIQQQGGGYAAGDFRKEVNADKPLPTLMGTQPNQFLIEPETDLSGKAIGEQWDRMGAATTRNGDGGKVEGESKYFQLIRPNPEEPCPTVTATAAQTGAASVVHPTERRKFSVGELKRLCGFPDDFILTGTYSQQVERLGRAVMPPVSRALGAAIRDRILIPWRNR